MESFQTLVPVCLQGLHFKAPPSGWVWSAAVGSLTGPSSHRQEVRRGGENTGERFSMCDVLPYIWEYIHTVYYSTYAYIKIFIRFFFLFYRIKEIGQPSLKDLFLL